MSKSLSYDSADVRALQRTAFDNAFVRARLLPDAHLRYAGRGWWVGLSVNK
jgi:hypothetical protein